MKSIGNNYEYRKYTFKNIDTMRHYRLAGMAAALLSGMALVSCSGTADEVSLTDYVEPRIGTAHCRWFHFAPGALPFGLAKPGPATNASLGNPSGWEATGYDYRDDSIEGFPCLHEFQVGGIVLMPTVGELKTVPGKPGTKGEGYRSSFSHDNEVATAGYYSVLLDDYDIKAEVTATERVAYQRFTFPESEHSHILFDIGNRQGESGPARDAHVRINEDGTVEGWVTTLPAYSNKYQDGATVTMFFSASLNRKPASFGTFVGSTVYEGARESKGVGAGAYLDFKTMEGEQITAQIGLSYTSVENARLNRETETRNGRLGFDKVRKASRETWESYLGKIRVEGGSREDMVKFYTGLYHALLGRGLAGDVNGAYPKNDGTIGMLPLEDGKPAFRFVNTDGIWGGQWNLVQVWALAYPEYLSDYVQTHLQVYKDAGWMGDGIACSRYVSGVGTNQLSLVIAAAYLNGIRDYDVELAYEAARKNELEGRDRPRGAGRVDTDQFVKYGYVPHQDSGDPGMAEGWQFSASHTLEYAFSCHAVAEMAREMGKMDDYVILDSLSRAWDRIYDDELDLVRPKTADGKFIEDFNPMQVWRGFQEGNAWQYTFYVPHDVKALVGKMGEDAFVSRLDDIFEKSRSMIFSGGTTINAFAGLETYYNQGNQPCLHISWLFNDAGAPYLTQKWTSAILDEFYGTDGIHGYGYGQDEDQGQLGAWYVISSLGIFDVAGLAENDADMAIGSPKFDKAVISLDKNYYKGDRFVITAENNAPGNVYVSSMKLDGAELETPYIRFSDVVKGGELTVTKSSEPIVR